MPEQWPVLKAKLTIGPKPIEAVVTASSKSVARAATISAEVAMLAASVVTPSSLVAPGSPRPSRHHTFVASLTLAAFVSLLSFAATNIVH